MHCQTSCAEISTRAQLCSRQARSMRYAMQIQQEKATQARVNNGLSYAQQLRLGLSLSLLSFYTFDFSLGTYRPALHARDSRDHRCWQAQLMKSKFLYIFAAVPKCRLAQLSHTLTHTFLQKNMLFVRFMAFSAAINTSSKSPFLPSSPPLPLCRPHVPLLQKMQKK